MEAGLIKIYCFADLPRLNYIASVLLTDILGLSFEITNDRRKLGKHPVINYSTENISGSFKVTPSGFLSERGIRQQKIQVSQWMDLPMIFEAESESDLPFDIFSASFYLISRYEEYASRNRDEHGRFMASSSLAFRHGFLMQPVIDLWARELSKLLVRKFHFLTFKRNEYRSLLTIDVDQPFAYIGKGFFRSVGGILKDIRSKNGHASERYQAVARGEPDPYNIFDYLFEQINNTGTEARFFIPVGDQSRFDNNPSWKSREYRDLVGKILGNFDAGIHPSYYAADEETRFSVEVDRFRDITGRSLTSSRYHYLRLFFPQSYLNLLQHGIAEDYSMGYPEEPGFRAGISRPFRYYDLSSERATGLLIYPFQVMDGTLLQYKKLTPYASSELIEKLVDTTKKTGGLFSSIWHNTTLLPTDEGKEWRIVFENMLRLQKQ